MRLLEWQSKRLLAKAGIPVPVGSVVESPYAAGDAAARLGKKVMVKAQIRIGGRGKAGVILSAVDASSAEMAARDLIGREIKGRVIRQVLVEEQIDAEQELYISFTVDYDARRSLLLFSSEGGVDVEATATNNFARAELNPLLPLPEYVVRDVLASAKVPRNIDLALYDLAKRLYGVYREYEATLLEVNPLLVLRDGMVVAADARMIIDDAAIERQPAIAEFGDSLLDSTISEQIKLKHDFDYIELDPGGNIGLISTGAGGTMMTIDLLIREGGRVINFADVRTGRIGRDPSRLIVVLEQLVQKPNFRVLLVSIFGAITDLAAFAEALLAALRARPISAKVYVRLQGRNEEAARELLATTGVTTYSSLESAVSAAASTAKESTP